MLFYESIGIWWMDTFRKVLIFDRYFHENIDIQSTLVRKYQCTIETTLYRRILLRHTVSLALPFLCTVPIWNHFKDYGYGKSIPIVSNFDSRRYFLSNISVSSWSYINNGNGIDSIATTGFGYTILVARAQKQVSLPQKVVFPFRVHI